MQEVRHQQGRKSAHVRQKPLPRPHRTQDKARHLHPLATAQGGGAAFAYLALIPDRHPGVGRGPAFTR